MEVEPPKRLVPVEGEPKAGVEVVPDEPKRDGLFWVEPKSELPPVFVVLEPENIVYLTLVTLYEKILNS